jgi:two-component system CheB/CheR fusion protein
MSNVTPGPAPTHVVGIGASAGGLDALERFFHDLPEDTGMAYVVVQHLSPDFKSLMDELLARKTRLPITLVADGMAVEANHVYLIPPKKEMIISGGRLHLSERERSHELTLPIDTFFRSLARDCGPRSVAIVLSGGGSDGSRGAREIHDSGGLVLVQDVDSAQFDGMPKTTRDSGIADFVLAPGDMPRVLVEHAAKGLLTPVPKLGKSGDDEEGELDVDALYKILQQEFGIDFTHYKPSTVTRRIERRLALAHSKNIDEYVRQLRSDRAELDILYRDLLIGVTRFFRDEKAYRALEENVLPELLQRGEPHTPVRVWIAGCATGEEAYSLAILLLDLMAQLQIERPLKIFATDVHRGSLEIAARASYDEQAVANVSQERLERYFFRSGNLYQVVPELRQMIVFAPHNVIKDAPFTRVDLITCRNLLIYLQPAAQQKALSLFHFALNRGGVLFLGPSESTGALGRDFETLDRHWRLYRKNQDQRLPIEGRIQAPVRGEPRPGVALRPAAAGRYSLTQLLGTYDALLDEVMPPALLVSDRGELVQSFSGASKLLQLRDGRQDLDVFDLVSAELKMVLVGGLKRALNEGGTVAFKGVKLGVSGDERPYKLTMRRIRSRTSAMFHVLITFEVMESAAAPRHSETEIDLDQVSYDQLRALEFELSHTKENLQAAIEELETSNEELQASNEELQSSNEELQSTNEELQSVNEELYTVNSEYQRKIAELTELTNDMDNLLSSTEVGTIFLDKQLRIRKFTPTIGEAFSLMPHDVGRSIETFAHKLQHPELLDDLRRVLETGQPVERELDGVVGKSFFSRILPYRTKGAVAGVVLTLIDVSGLKAAEDALFHERYLLNSLLATVPDAIYFKDASGRYLRANQTMASLHGLNDPRELVGKTPFEVPNRDLALALHRADEAVLRTGAAEHYKLESRRQPDGSMQWNLVTRLALTSADGSIVGVITIFRDVSDQRRAEEKIKEAVARRDQFLAMLSHELRNPLGAIVTATTLLKEDGAEAEPRARLLGTLERQSQQMARLLDDLLEASRVTQNKIELRKTAVELTAAVREAAEAVRDVTEGRDLTFETSIPDEAMYVEADPTRLQQIQMNLLSNAAKYTPQGGRVRLELLREGDEAVIRVSDTGVGIPREMLESVFDLFVQSNRTLDRAAGGLGVGLTLARSLAQLHDGDISAHSDGEGKGSTFELRLPLTAAEAQTARVPRPQPKFTRGTKIVVVEDNEDSRELLCELLSRVGFDCHTADTGTAAIELIDEVRPEIALMDVGLPELNGYEVAKRLRDNPAHAQMYLVALTGYGRSSDRAASRDAGFDEHLVKPVQADKLLSVLARFHGNGKAKDKESASNADAWEAGE